MTAPITTTSSHLRLGTRASMLARAQSRQIASALMARHPGLTVELVLVQTTGDVVQDRPLHEIGGKGVFIKELEIALLDRRIDFAVHSYKDVPVTMPLVAQERLCIAAVPAREDARDAILFRVGASHELADSRVIGTSSLRRRSQLLTLAPNARIDPLRGNIDTRLRKLAAGEYDAIVLAVAGLKRAGLFDPATALFADMIPAAGQGALALQCLNDSAEVRSTLQALHDAPTALSVDAERQVVHLLGGDCHSPIGALAVCDENQITLRTCVARRGGELPVVYATASRPLPESSLVALDCVEQLRRAGADSLLHDV